MFTFTQMTYGCIISHHDLWPMLLRAYQFTPPSSDMATSLQKMLGQPRSLVVSVIVPGCMFHSFEIPLREFLLAEVRSGDCWANADPTTWSFDLACLIEGGDRLLQPPAEFRLE